jgi:ethanolamine permease
MDQAQNHFSRTLGPLTLWGLGVGYVISGMYFGWNLGLPQGGSLGLAIATCIIALMAVTFNFSYCELTCAIPKAGGAFNYTSSAFGPYWGFLAGVVQLIEFIFAPPAIASAIGAYLGLLFPKGHSFIFALIAYFLFTLINICGVKIAAMFELIVTLLAVIGILIFSGIMLPHLNFENLLLNALPHGYMGVLMAIPFALWFFLGLEGIANVVEETLNPQRNIVIGLSSAILTLIILCILTFVSSIGVGGWEKVVFAFPGAAPSDSPLPLALGQVINEHQVLFRLLISIGLFGLIASFNGFILAAGRATYEFSLMGYAPTLLSRLHHKFKTPAKAILFNTSIGIAILCTGKTAEIIVLACFGALSLYLLSMLSLFALRKTKPHMKRPFRVPFYPYTPLIATIIASGSLIVLIFNNLKLALVYFVILVFSTVWFKFKVRNKQPVQAFNHEVLQ